MDNNNRKNDPNHNRQGWGIILITTLLVTFMVMGFYSLMRGSGLEEISYDKFLEMVEDGEVQEVSLNSDRIYVTLTAEARSEMLKENALPGSAGSLLGRSRSRCSSRRAETPKMHRTGSSEKWSMTRITIPGM